MTTCNICTSTGGIDYFPAPFEVKFPAGVTNASFRVLIADDEVAEYTESFFLYIDYVSLYYLMDVYDPDRVHVYIDDNDCKLNLLCIRSDLQNPEQSCILWKVLMLLCSTVPINSNFVCTNVDTCRNMTQVQ